MISILKHPYICSFSKNSVDFEVKTDMYFKSVMVYPGIELTIDSKLANGEHFAIQWINPETLEAEEVRLVAKDGTNPDAYANYYEVPDSAWVGSLEDYSDIIFEKLKEHTLLNGLFTLEHNTHFVITITAQRAVAELIPMWATNQTSTHISSTITQGFILPDAREGYSLKALVFFEKSYLSDSFEMVASLEMVVDQDSKSYIDLASTLDSEIENSWTEYPVPFANFRTYKATNLRRYYIKFVESWYGEPQPRSTVSDVLNIHWGGVCTDDQLIADPVTLMSSGKSFLTWWPSGKRNSKVQNDWLGWMNLLGPGSFNIKIKVVTDVDTHISTVATISLELFETVVFNSGYNAAELDVLYSSETVKKWGFYIEQDGDPVSDEFWYFLDHDCDPRVILYFNSFGVPETFLTSREWQESMNVSTEVANRSAAFGLKSLYPKTFVFDSKHTTSMNAVSKLLSNNEALRLQSVINSTISFVLENDRWIPCILNSGKTPIIDRTAFTQRIELEILKANESDRASFFDIQPDLLVVVANGIEKVSLVSNNLDYINYSTLQCYLNGVLVDTLTWNNPQKAYIPTSSLIEEGLYKFVGSIETTLGTHEVIKFYQYKLVCVSFSMYDTGYRRFYLDSSSPSETVQVDWGDGVVANEVYDNTSTTIDHTYTKTGKKDVRLKKASFDDVIGLSFADNFGVPDFGKFPNLEAMSYTNGPTANWYLSQLENLIIVNFNNTGVSSLNIGFQKNLGAMILADSGITTAELDNLFKELWQFRKLYVNEPLINLGGLGYTPSSVFDDIKNGTNEYAGEGLVANYGWTINIIP